MTLINVKTRTITRAVFFSIFVLICFIQCYSIMRSYLQYPIAIDMYDVSPNLISILPGLTICNNNRLSLRKLIQRHPAIRRALTDKYPDWVEHEKPQLGRKNFNRFRDDLSIIYRDANYTPQDDLNNSTLTRLFAIQPEPDNMIKWLGCARAWADSVNCAKLNRIESIQDRRCVTILHQGSVTYDLENRPYLFNSTQDSRGGYGYFDAKEVIQMVIDFHPEDYGDLKRQVGARVLFHGNNFVASSNELDFYITRGYRYDFNIDREVLILLDKPYVGCYDYEGANVHKFKHSINPRVPLYGDTCFQNCVATNMVHLLNCWPPMIPYFRDDLLDPHRNISNCLWGQETLFFTLYREMLRALDFKNRKKIALSTGNMSLLLVKEDEHEKNIRNQMRTHKKIRRYCYRRCMVACKLTRYSVSVTRSPWPSEIRLTLDKDGKEHRLRHCCALMAVKYSHFHHSVQQFMPKYYLVDTIGNVGGLLAVWLGLSIISLYHAIQKLIDICNQQTLFSKCKIRAAGGKETNGTLQAE